MASPQSRRERAGIPRSNGRNTEYDSQEARTMSAQPVACVGFAHPDHRARTRERRSAIVVNLIATAALTASIAVAAVTVSIGIARTVPPTTNRVAASVSAPQARLLIDLSRFDQEKVQGRRHG
jgi:hypothetical protein